MTDREDQPLRFEVLVPPKSPEAVAALHGLARLGAEVREITPPTYLSLSEIIEAGNEHAGHIGEYLRARITQLRRASHGSIEIRNSKAFLRMERGGQFGLYTDNSFLGSADTSRETLVDEARKKIETLAIPFDVDIRPPSTTALSQVVSGFNAIDAQVNRDKLARYLTRNGLNQNELHGTLGKAADVLNWLAGIGVKPDPAAREIPGEYVGKDELIGTLRKSQLSQSQQQYIINIIRDNLRSQIATGKPKNGNEMIIEGQCQIEADQGGGIRNVNWERIHLDSLLRLAFQLTKSRVEVPAFLHNIEVHLRDYRASQINE